MVIVMTDAASLLSASVLRNLADKLYEKRKNAALEVEGVVKSLAAQGETEKVSALINVLINDFAMSPQANHRKGGLIGLAAATVGLAGEASQYLARIVPPVLHSFTDQDSRVRYYACEALYNIAKVSRGDFIVFFNDVFDALCKLSADSDPNVQNAAHLLDRLVKDIVTEGDQFSIEEFIPLLRERMNVLNPFVRQFLVGWITVLDSVPDIDMLGFLPDFLDGLFNMLSDSNHEIRQQADTALNEFLQEIRNAPSVDYRRMTEILVQRASAPDEFMRLTAVTWIHEFVKLGQDYLVPYYADILGALLPCIADKEEKIRAVGKETNDELREAKREGLDIEKVLAVARREMANENEATRLEALRWIAALLERHRTQVLSFLDDLFPALLGALSDSSDAVVLLVLEVQAAIAKETLHFRHLMVFLLHRFSKDRALLEKRGSLVLRRLCVLLDAERVYRELGSILEGEADLEFASLMIQALNLILLTASELAGLRELLRASLCSPEGQALFLSLYSSWCHAPVATVSLCLLAQAYGHASALITCLKETDINVRLLVQVDKLVHLLETPVFAYLRLQLLEPGRYPALLKALYGLLMLLPQQSGAFMILRTRLKSVPTHALMHMSSHPPETEYSNRGKSGGSPVSTAVASVLRRAASMKDDRRQGLGGLGPPLEEGASQAEGESGRPPLPAIDFAGKLQQFELMQRQHQLMRAAERQKQQQGMNGLPAETSPQETIARDMVGEASNRSRGSFPEDGVSQVGPRPSWRS
ncbi:vacuole morphology and inheritance protein 14 [Klebsormidium nitens]|uniref:Vacuole morphology and inheritance protein 14 n=1 Tax=Klebsormidium nitens TaxID=105231 RepID=A0A1Y1IEI9_KLENI|nr:vacuole morphology and inheritance protein 14 [Klebsormidium nitens]|eukprot:GAQ89365.1 vacuole morphology and inheritance protein 14 [Klebsormidium nitens]